MRTAGRARTSAAAGGGPGPRAHSANEIAEQLGVSRTPVREALLVLADTGMVRLERNRGFRVLQRSPEHIAEVFHLRLHEPILAALSALDPAAAAAAVEYHLRHTGALLLTQVAAGNGVPVPARALTLLYQGAPGESAAASRDTVPPGRRESRNPPGCEKPGPQRD